jgi:hypothetical protein
MKPEKTRKILSPKIPNNFPNFSKSFSYFFSFFFSYSYFPFLFFFSFLFLLSFLFFSFLPLFFPFHLIPWPAPLLAVRLALANTAGPFSPPARYAGLAPHSTAWTKT